MANSGVETDLLSEIQNAFLSEKQNLVVQNVGTQYDPVEVCLDRSVAETVNHVFKHKVRETDERSRVQFVPIYVPDDTTCSLIIAPGFEPIARLHCLLQNFLFFFNLKSILIAHFFSFKL